jgi:hypothetical protein
VIEYGNTWWKQVDSHWRGRQVLTIERTGVLESGWVWITEPLNPPSLID